MVEQICQYCKNEIRPLDKHVAAIKDAGTVIHERSPLTPVNLQEVTCILTRTVIVNVKQTNDNA